MNETNRRPRKRQRETIETLIRHYRPPHKRQPPTINSWEALDTIVRGKNVPSRIILNLDGTKIELTIKKGQRRCLYSVVGST